MSRFEVPFTNMGEEEDEQQLIPPEMMNELPDEFRLFLTEELTRENGTELVQAMYELNDMNEKLGTEIPILLIINTPGGDLQSCQMICDVMNEISTPVHTKCFGQACSAGIMIFMNGEPGFRTSSQSAQFMSHRFSTAVEGSHAELKYHNEEMERMHERLIDHYITCTGLTKKKVEDNLLAEHDTWLTAEDCKGYNIVDNIIEGKKKNVRRRARKPRASSKSVKK